MFYWDFAIVVIIPRGDVILIQFVGRKPLIFMETRRLDGTWQCLVAFYIWGLGELHLFVRWIDLHWLFAGFAIGRL